MGFGYDYVAIVRLGADQGGYFAFQIEHDLADYEPFTNKSWQHAWLGKDNHMEIIHFHSPSMAVDANTTFTVRPLFEILFYEHSLVTTSWGLHRLPKILHNV